MEIEQFVKKTESCCVLRSVRGSGIIHFESRFTGASRTEAIQNRIEWNRILYYTGVQQDLKVHSSGAFEHMNVRDEKNDLRCRNRSHVSV